MPAPRLTARLDKWLWQARFFKSRALATKAIEAGEVRLNAVHCRKPAHPVGEGDTLTFLQAGRVRVIRILAPGHRRGPAIEAQTLYADLDAAGESGEPPESGPAPDPGPDRRNAPVSAAPRLD